MKWISIKDQLPEFDKEVLVLTDDGWLMNATYDQGIGNDTIWFEEEIEVTIKKTGKKYKRKVEKTRKEPKIEFWWDYPHHTCEQCCGYGEEIALAVTHWMELPEEPKDK